MKKVLTTLGAIALICAGSLFTACQGMVAGDEINNYATSPVSTVSFTTAKACPGVNVLKWNAVNDVSAYVVYRTTSNGHVEEVVSPSSTNLEFIDMNIDQNTSYTYRVVAIPTTDTVRDSSSTTVTLSTGTWPAEGTVFSALEGGKDNGLTASSISVKRTTSTSNYVKATFPVKPYAAYVVMLSQENGGLLKEAETMDSYVTLYGYNYNGKATVTLPAIYAGKKQVTVVAQPLNQELYGASAVASSATVDITAAQTFSSATASGITATWTNYSSTTKKATARVSFVPQELYGEEFATSEYTVYRALVDSNGETVTINNESKNVYASITSLGSPSKDIEKSSVDQTVYYIDDSEIDLSYASDIASVRFYVVLNHNGNFKTQSTAIVVPDSSDSSWHYTPDSAPSTTTPLTNSIKIYDIFISQDGTINLKADKNYTSETVTATYGTFATENEALTAVNSELPNALTEDTENSSSWYWCATAGTAKANTSKYYAFRVVSKLTGSLSDDVATIVAKPVSTTGGYYWDVIGSHPYNYATVSTPTVSVEKTVGTEYYESVKLSYATSNAKYYNIWRGGTLLASRTTDKTYTDTSAALKSTSLDDTIYYYVEAVSYYNSAEASVSVSSLKAPSITKSGSTISWSSNSSATRYYIYRATSESALSTASYYDYTTYASFTVTPSFASDYYYGVKAYDGTDYSEMSNIIKVEKAAAPTVSYTNGTLSWTSISGTTSYYVYKAETEAALQALETSDYVLSFTSTSYTVPLEFENDYYYSVRAYSSSEGAYTDLGNAVKVEKFPVTVSNPATWQVVTTGTYTFAKADDSNVWTSNNDGIRNSSATITWVIKVENEANVSIPWTVSSESGYDKLTVILDDVTKVNESSGTNENTISATLTAGYHTLTATYSKDGSNDSGTDTATLTLDPVSF